MKTHLVLELRTCCLVEVELCGSFRSKCVDGLSRFGGKTVPKLGHYPNPLEFALPVAYLEPETRKFEGSSRAGTRSAI